MLYGVIKEGTAAHSTLHSISNRTLMPILPRGNREWSVCCCFWMAKHCHRGGTRHTHMFVVWCVLFRFRWRNNFIMSRKCNAFCWTMTPGYSTWTSCDGHTCQQMAMMLRWMPVVILKVRMCGGVSEVNQLPVRIMRLIKQQKKHEILYHLVLGNVVEDER